MNIRQVEAFRAVMRTGSVTGASAALSVSQPSISRHLKNLELATGLRLFDHQRGQMRPTGEARDFMREVERTFSGLEELRVAADRIRKGSVSTLCIGTCPSVMFDVIPRTLTPLQRQLPSLIVSIRNLESERVYELVRAGELDVGIVAVLDRLSDVVVVRRLEVPCVVIMRQGHPLSGCDVLTADDMADFPFVAPERTLLVTSNAGRKLAERLAAVTCAEVQASYAACVVALSGDHTALVDPFTAKFFTDSVQLVARPLKSQISYSLAVILPKERETSAFVGPFLRHLSKSLSLRRTRKARLSPYRINVGE